MENGLIFVAAARTSASAGAAAFVWQTGQFSTVTNAVVGTFVYTLADSYALDHDDMVPFFQTDGAVAASGLVSYGIASTSDVIKSVTVLKEAALGGASALTDVAHWITLYKRPPST